MKINLTNGNGNWYSADEAAAALEDARSMLGEGYWDIIVELMDNDTCEAVAIDIAPCTNEEFLREYLNRASADLVIG